MVIGKYPNISYIVYMKKIYKQIIIYIFCSLIFCFVNELSLAAVDEMSGGNGSMNSNKEMGETGGRTTEEEKVPSFTVVLYANEECFDIIGENRLSVKRNDRAMFMLCMKNGYIAESVSAGTGQVETEIINGIDGLTTIIIKNVRYQSSFTVNCVKAGAYIDYYPNGGYYLSGEDADKPYREGYDFVHQLRPNSEIGTDRIIRAGYVQTGWNTSSAGDGEHIGLGSRVSVKDGNVLCLYAEWKKETPEREFVFKNGASGYYIKCYLGHREEIVIPAYYNGKEVKGILRDAFLNNDVVKTVILPTTIREISDGAFRNCTLKEVFLYDNIEYISDDSFLDCDEFCTVHINAIEPPKFGKNLYSEYNFADKYDILILQKEKEKVVFFGGSGVYFSVNPIQVEKALEEAGIKKICINMGVNGWFCGPAQIEMISAFLNEGDVFIHAPETSSRYNVCYSDTMTPEYGTFTYNKLRLYYCVEANFDLFSLIDIRNISDFFSGFREFNDLRETRPAISYTEYKNDGEIDWYGELITNPMGYIDLRGGFALRRDHHTDNAGEADIVLEYITQGKTRERLNEYYNQLNKKGVMVFFTTAPINGTTLEARRKDPSAFNKISSKDDAFYYGRPCDIPQPDYKTLEDWIADYERAEYDVFGSKILLPLSKTVYKAADFFEPDYHLTDEASKLYTADLVNALIEVLSVPTSP